MTFSDQSTFSINKKKLRKENNFFELRCKTEKLWEGKASWLKTIILVEKKPVPWYSKKECVKKCLKIYKKFMAEGRIWTHQRHFPTAVTPGTCRIQDTNDSAESISARHGQFQKMEKISQLFDCAFLFRKFKSIEKKSLHY